MSEELKFDRLGFVLFCLETYRLAKGMKGPVVVDIFKSGGVFDFLEQNGDVLHCEGEDEIVSQIDEFLSTRKNILNKNVDAEITRG